MITNTLTEDRDEQDCVDNCSYSLHLKFWNRPNRYVCRVKPLPKLKTTTTTLLTINLSEIKQNKVFTKRTLHII